MPQMTRRDVVAASAALSAGALLPAPGRADIPGAHDVSAAPGPRERLRFDSGWSFAFGHGTDPTKDFDFGFGQADFSKTGIVKIAKPAFDDAAWRTVDLPHDWAVELPLVQDDKGEGDAQLRSHGYRPLGRRYPETSVGWYRRTFDIPVGDRGRRVAIEFDGAMRDVLVFVNGCFIGRNNNGYAPFRFDLTDFLVYGGKNVIAIRVDASFGDGWFYEGAGLYRHVWLCKTDAVHLRAWETVVRSTLRDGQAALELTAIADNAGRAPVDAALAWEIIDAQGGVVARAETPAQKIAPGGGATYQARAVIANPSSWALETPHLYSAVAKVLAAGATRDVEAVSFGVRDARFDATRGFFLNGQSVKIQGTCNHQDHAGVGAALPDRLQTYRLELLKGMGCNAVRTSHNMPTPEWVEACDRMGVLMVCETRQMSSNPSGLAELDLMVKRFRNSPSIIAWSIGNEEYLLQDGEMAPQGARIARAMVDRCHDLDPTRPVTAAVNWNNEAGVSEPLDLVGFNYHPEFPEPFHKKYPHRPIYGSEVSSAVSTRGVYETDEARHTVNSYNGVVGWGATPEQWWGQYGAHDWMTGGFAWTGFDYRGEPTPYAWPSNSSQFGILDLCGFPKDYYYYYKAWWSKAPSLHLFPHWNWPGNEGKPVSVWVYSNLDEIELLLNGKSLGRKGMPPLKHVEWQVPYQPGVIEAIGRRGGRVVLRQRRETTGPGMRLRLTPDRDAIDADGRDVAMITVDLLDARGRLVPTADDLVKLRVSGPGRLIGVGNGDPNSLESDKAPQRRLFSGLAQVIVQSTGQPGRILVEAVDGLDRSKPLVAATLTLKADAPVLTSAPATASVPSRRR